MHRLVPLLCAVPVLALAGCGGDETTTTTGSAGAVGCAEVKAPTPAPRPVTGDYEFLDPSRRYLVTMQTSCGTFTILLDPQRSPNAAASFLWLVELGYYDHTIFHRIVPGSLIEGGDPTATGSGGPGYTTQDTPPEDTRYTHGVVAMAKPPGEPAGTAGGRFFVVTTAEAPLPPEYAIVGQVEDGLDVVDAIGGLGGADEKPAQVVEIESATFTDT